MRRTTTAATGMADDRLAEGRYEPVAMGVLPNGSLRGYSTVLNPILEWREGQLNWIAPEIQVHIPNFEQEQEGSLAEWEARQRVEARNRELEAQLPNPSLSKSRFQNGLQCLKRLYLETYHRELADPIDAGRQAIFDSGTAVGEFARQRFPGGRLVEQSHTDHRQAVETTRSLLDDVSLPAIYEAGFTYESIRTRVDVLSRVGPDSFDLIEVKSTAGVKAEHYTDVAIQLYVVEGSGVPVNRAFLMHLNRDYVYQGGEHDLHELFALQDVTDTARSFVESAVPSKLPRYVGCVATGIRAG